MAPPLDGSDPPDRLPRWLLIGLALAVVVLRLWGLGRLPGINGDEAWLAVEAKHLVYGQPFVLRTPTHMFISPLLFGSQAALLAVLEPSGWLLRLPVALWSLAALGLFFRLHHKLYGDRDEAALTALLLGALPLGWAYGRLAWDPGFLIFAMILFLFPLLGWLRRRSQVRSLAWACAGSVLLVWTHLTAAVAVATLVAGGWLLERRSLRTWLLAAGGLAGLVGGVSWLGRDHQIDTYYLIDLPLERLRQPWETLRMLAAPGQMLSGVRAFSYLAGMPEADWTWWLAAALTVGLWCLAWQQRRAEDPADRVLALSWLVLPLPWWATSGLLGQGDQSKERYVIWLLPLAALLVVRWLRARTRHWRAAALGLVALALVQSVALVGCLEDTPWPEGQHRTFWTAAEEPKVVAAERIMAAALPGEQIRVEVSDWWLEHPLKYLLPEGSAVGVRVGAARFAVLWWEAGQRVAAGCELLQTSTGRPLLQVCIQPASGRALLPVTP